MSSRHVFVVCGGAMTFDDTSYVKIMKLLFYYIEEENHRYSVLGYRIDAGPGKLQSCPFVPFIIISSAAHSRYFCHLSLKKISIPHS